MRHSAAVRSLRSAMRYGMCRLLVCLAALCLAVMGPAAARENNFTGVRAGDEREVIGVKLCWCPAGKFLMGSPPSEPERRPGEDQVEVTLTRGFWMAKYETTQGLWKRVAGELPGPLTAELP